MERLLNRAGPPPPSDPAWVTSDKIGGVALHPDGRLALALIGGHLDVRTWPSRAEEHRRKVSKARLTCCAFAGDVIAVGGDGGGYLDPGKRVVKDAVTSVAGHGAIAAFGTASGDVVIVDLPAGRHRYRISLEEGPIGSLVVGADGTRVAVMPQSGAVHVLDADTGTPVARHAGVTAGHLALAPDARHAVGLIRSERGSDLLEYTDTLVRFRLADGAIDEGASALAPGAGDGTNWRAWAWPIAAHGEGVIASTHALGRPNLLGWWPAPNVPSHKLSVVHRPHAITSAGGRLLAASETNVSELHPARIDAYSRQRHGAGAVALRGGSEALAVRGPIRDTHVSIWSPELKLVTRVDGPSVYNAVPGPGGAAVVRRKSLLELWKPGATEPEALGEGNHLTHALFCGDVFVTVEKGRLRRFAAGDELDAIDQAVEGPLAAAGAHVYGCFKKKLVRIDVETGDVTTIKAPFKQSSRTFVTELAVREDEQIALAREHLDDLVVLDLATNRVQKVAINGAIVGFVGDRLAVLHGGRGPCAFDLQSGQIVWEWDAKSKSAAKHELAKVNAWHERAVLVDGDRVVCAAYNRLVVFDGASGDVLQVLRLETDYVEHLARCGETVVVAYPSGQLDGFRIEE